MKDNKKVNTNDEIPSSSKIAFAWVLLIILLASTGGLVYLKNFYVLEDNTENTEEENKISSVITTVLTSIVDNFNSSEKINEYQTDGLTLSATLNEDTIIVAYTSTTDNGTSNYKYDSTSFSLVSSFLSDNKEINDKIFTIMVDACRKYRNLDDDVSSKIESFINDGIEDTGISKSISDTEITYSIDIRYPLDESYFQVTADTNQSNDTDEDNSNEDTTNDNIEEENQINE